ncbi:XyeB family radical SAM/SPASM peptide maturase [Kosakonia cowanii]|nr:XyeB family radical SAM/SPASM peptide maturase [Kosakonia cowanii]
MKSIEHLEIIVKISERCNIDCTYCYVFNKGNDLAINSQTIIKKNTINSFRDFLESASKGFDIKTIQIDFHGGEPLLLKKDRFNFLCKTLREGDYRGSRLVLSCQSNGVLIDDEWIDIFHKWDVGVSVSMDGPKHIHDAARIDKNGKGTYDQVVAGFRKLQDAWKENKISTQPGILCVANTNLKGVEIYRHFIDDLQCKGFDFLIPDETHDSNIDASKLYDFYESVIDEYFIDADIDIKFRYLKVLIQGMLNPGTYAIAGLNAVNNDIVALTMGANGDIYIDDTLRSTSDKAFSKIINISSGSLGDILSSWQYLEYTKFANTLPIECETCTWKKLCGGGGLVQRYSKEQRFNGKSVYCHSLKKIYGRVASHLIESGIDETHILKSLGCNDGN